MSLTCCCVINLAHSLLMWDMQVLTCHHYNCVILTLSLHVCGCTACCAVLMISMTVRAFLYSNSASYGSRTFSRIRVLIARVCFKLICLILIILSSTGFHAGCGQHHTLMAYSARRTCFVTCTALKSDWRFTAPCDSHHVPS